MGIPKVYQIAGPLPRLLRDGLLLRADERLLNATTAACNELNETTQLQFDAIVLNDEPGDESDNGPGAIEYATSLMFIGLAMAATNEPVTVWPSGRDGAKKEPPQPSPAVGASGCG